MHKGGYLCAIVLCCSVFTLYWGSTNATASDEEGEGSLVVRVNYPAAALCESCGLLLGSNLNWTVIDFASSNATNMVPSANGLMARIAPDVWLKRLTFNATWANARIELTVIRFTHQIG